MLRDYNRASVLEHPRINNYELQKRIVRNALVYALPYHYN